MGMANFHQELPGSMYEFNSDYASISSPYQNMNLENGFTFDHDSMDPHPPFHPTNPDPPIDSSAPFSGAYPHGDIPDNVCDNNESANAVIKYISEMLMEEDLEGQSYMLQDCLALQAAEKSFYDVLGQRYPPLPDQPLPCVNHSIDSPDHSFPSSCGSSNDNAANSLVESDYTFDQTQLQNSLINSHDSTFLAPNPYTEIQPFGSFMIPNLYGEILPFEQLNGGIGEVGKTSLNGGVNIASKSDLTKPLAPEVEVTATEKSVIYSLPNGMRGRKNDHRDDSDHLEEGRSNKHSALSLAESKESEMYDDVLLCKAESNGFALCSLNGPLHSGRRSKLLQEQNGASKGSNGGTTKTKKKRGNKSEVVDLWTLLTQCAQAVTSYDKRTANELLKQIKRHSSPFGDGMQRMAHYFANGLEARLDGTGTLFNIPFVSNRISAADILKAYKLYISVCPFKKMSNFIVNKTVVKLAEKATRLHIIDFGILYGFQWPCLIQRLSVRPGGPPKLRITGIELPQPGLRPAERVEETGHRLKRYCERFNVPFECNVIAQKWETLKLEDLKIDRNELTVVNCLYRMRNLPDDTEVVDSPRDIVLKLIKRINPDIFIHGVTNGTYSTPFFYTRFREALFHFSALFDILEATVPREDEERLIFERETFGRDIMNVIGCEDKQRVERPESYKKWQVRNTKAGFRQLPLNQEILREVKKMVSSGYHPDFDVNEDGQWILQGWKGRVTHALSCWKPVQE